MSVTTNHNTLGLSQDGWFAFGLGAVSLYSAGMCFLSIPAQYGLRSVLVGLFAAVALGGLAWSGYRIVGQLHGRRLGSWLVAIVLAVIASLLLSWGMAFVFNHWGSTLVFNQANGDLIGYAPSPADGGFDGSTYTPLEVPASEAPGVPG